MFAVGGGELRPEEASEVVLNLRPVKGTHRLPSKLEVINNPSPSLSRRLAEPVKNFAHTACEEPFEGKATMEEVYTSNERLYSQNEVKQMNSMVEILDKECDEVRQKGKKGNLLLCSPILGNSGSLLHHRPTKLRVIGMVRTKTYIESFACTFCPLFIIC